MTEEEWRPVLGHKGSYEVSDYGRVRSLERSVQKRYRDGRFIASKVRGGMLKLGKRTADGYLTANVGPGKRLVHQLVLEAFAGPRPGGMVACHENGIRDDNRPENLRWDTQAANLRDMARHGTGRNQNSGKTLCIREHELTAENTHVDKGGRRHCRKCWSARRSEA